MSKNWCCQVFWGFEKSYDQACFVDRHINCIQHCCVTHFYCHIFILPFPVTVKEIDKSPPKIATVNSSDLIFYDRFEHSLDMVTA